MIPILTPFPYFEQAPPSTDVFPEDGKRHTLTGNFRLHKNFQSNFLPANRDVLVYLPPGYETDVDRHYPVLYLHDGQNLFDGATSFVPGQEWRLDETAESLIRAGRVQPIIIVGIYNAGSHRVDEYTPTQERRTGHGGRADLYARLLVEELKPFIDSHYRTQKDASHTALGGSSLGGLATLYIGITRPRTFGKLAVMSPSVWWDKRTILDDVRHLTAKPALRVWLDVGTAEGNNPGGILTDVRKLRDFMIRKGWRLGDDLAYVEAQGAGHNESAWAARVGAMLEFLFPAQ
jgi:predicted alpha/beta superfamily hydrolase